MLFFNLVFTKIFEVPYDVTYLDFLFQLTEHKL